MHRSFDVLLSPTTNWGGQNNHNQVFAKLGVAFEMPFNLVNFAAAFRA